jgi:hypothetical protein
MAKPAEGERDVDGSAAREPAARPRRRTEKADGESTVLAKIAAMPEQFRAIGERLDAIIRASAPTLSPTLWYGMPAYARNGKVVCFFRADKYVTLGFTEDAHLFDEGDHMRPSAYSLRELAAAEEAEIGSLVMKAAQ